MKYRTGLFVLLCLASAIWFCGCTAPQSSPATLPIATGTSVPPTQAPVTGSHVFTLRVDALAPDSVLPDEYTCKGVMMESPELSWEKIPQGTKSLVLIMDDPDAPGGTFTHWLLYNIPPSTRRIDRAQSHAKVLASGAQLGDTSAGSRGYCPPCPPSGSVHRYVFSLYALDYEIGMPTADRNGIDTAMSGHVLGHETFITTFLR
jgi:Raf kinase inhibitor-like YbhB/YbcL family protein